MKDWVKTGAHINGKMLYLEKYCEQENIHPRFIFTPFDPIVSVHILNWAIFPFHNVWIESQQYWANLVRVK